MLAVTIGEVWPIALAIIGAAASWPLARAKSKSAQLALAISERDVERSAREAQAKRHEDEIRDMERRHAMAIGELRGQIQTITADFAQRIAIPIAECVIEKVDEWAVRRTA